MQGNNPWLLAEFEKAGSQSKEGECRSHLYNGRWSNCQHGHQESSISLPETQDTKASNHGSASISSGALGIDFTQRGEDVVDVYSSFAKLIKRVSENVESVVEESANNFIQHPLAILRRHGYAQ